jgi:protein-disulfide isomerase
MHDQLLEHQDKLQMADLVSYADRLGLDVARFTEELQGHVGANRIAQDVEGADLSRVSGTPTFFINGRRHHGAYDIDHLSRAVRAAGARAKLAAS